METEQLTEKQAQRRSLMLTGSVWKVVPAIALPMVVSMVIDSVYNLADTYFVSSLGTAATAAVGVNNALMSFMRAIALGFGVGAASYISRLLGAKRPEEASRTASTAVFCAMGTLSVFAAVAIVFLNPLVSLLGATESSALGAAQYALYILLAAPFTAGTVCLSQCLRAEGSTTYSMIGMVSGCVINLGLDPLFIFVFEWGVPGAAAATAISKVISCAVLALPYLRRKSLLEVSFKMFTPKRRILGEIARMGIPTFLRISLLSISAMLTNNIAGDYSDSALAAVTVSNKIMMFVGSMVVGFGQGFQPIAGYCWGAKYYKRIKKAFWATSAIGLLICLLFGTALFVFAPQLTALFSKYDPEVIRISAYMVRAQSLTLPLHCWIMVIIGLFQALGRAFEATVLGMSRQALSFLPCLFILTALYGLSGLMLAQPAADVITTLVALPFFVSVMRRISRLARENPLPVSEYMECAVVIDDEFN